jgi:hypothetical protein
MARATADHVRDRPRRNGTAHAFLEGGLLQGASVKVEAREKAQNVEIAQEELGRVARDRKCIDVTFKAR